MAPLKERAFTVSVVDERGAYVDGVQTQIFVNKIPSVQRYYRKGKPFVTHLSEGLQSVDVQVTFGKFRSRETVQTDIGTYTVTIPDEYVSQPANASPEPSVPAREPGTKTWVTVLGIAVPAVVALVVAYWQFVYKPEHQPKDFQIGIFVTDGSTRKPVPTASVTLVRATRKEDKPADSLGTARFQVYPEEAKNLRVEASAEGYAPGSREIDATGADKQFYLALSPLSLPKPKSGAGSNGGAVSPLVALAGTWEVVIESDVNNARLKKGTFDFMPHDIVVGPPPSDGPYSEQKGRRYSVDSQKAVMPPYSSSCFRATEGRPLFALIVVPVCSAEQTCGNWGKNHGRGNAHSQSREVVSDHRWLDSRGGARSLVRSDASERR